MDNAEIIYERPTKTSDVQSSGQLLITVRFLLLPAVVMSVITFPVLLLATVMITDAGTQQAITLAVILLLVLGLYSAATPAAFIRWMQWSRLSPALLLFYAVLSLAAAVLEPSIPAIFPLYFISIVTQTDINELSMDLGIVIFVVFCVVIPAVGAITILLSTRVKSAPSSNM